MGSVNKIATTLALATSLVLASCGARPLLSGDPELQCDLIMTTDTEQPAQSLGGEVVKYSSPMDCSRFMDKIEALSVGEKKYNIDYYIRLPGDRLPKSAEVRSGDFVMTGTKDSSGMLVIRALVEFDPAEKITFDSRISLTLSFDGYTRIDEILPPAPTAVELYMSPVP